VSCSSYRTARPDVRCPISFWIVRIPISRIAVNQSASWLFQRHLLSFSVSTRPSDPLGIRDGVALVAACCAVQRGQAPRHYCQTSD
jgi:hypothetical protein